PFPFGGFLWQSYRLQTRSGRNRPAPAQPERRPARSCRLRAGIGAGIGPGAVPDRKRRPIDQDWMRQMKATLSSGLKLAALLAVLASTQAQAGYVNNRQQYLALTPEARAGYVQGLADSLNYMYADDTLSTAVTKKARNRCLADQRTTAAILADRITTAYKNDRVAGIAPSAMFMLTMGDTCKSYINQERAGFGLPPIP
ncbi:MAG: hypothetical protein QM676_00505, partial [Novosphingobium sp.]